MLNIMCVIPNIKIEDVRYENVKSAADNINKLLGEAVKSGWNTGDFKQLNSNIAYAYELINKCDSLKPTELCDLSVIIYFNALIEL